MMQTRQRQQAAAANNGGGGGGGGAVLGEDVIVLGSCDASAQLPTNPEMPADIFTSCLTTPLRMVLRFASRNVLLHLPGMAGGLSPPPTHDPRTYQTNKPRACRCMAGGAIDTLPGALSDRRSPLGELNWIFTAITDSIAWDMLPRPLFRRYAHAHGRWHTALDHLLHPSSHLHATTA